MSETGMLSPANSSPRKWPRTSRKGCRSPLSASIVLIAGAVVWALFQQIATINTGPAGSLLDRRDAGLSKILVEVAKDHPYTKCAATELRPRQMLEYEPTSKVLSQLKKYPSIEGAVKDNKFIEFLIKDVPCWGMDNCCETNTYIRADAKEDLYTFKHVFQQHHLRIIYAIFRNSTPKYILDAGTGSGLTTQMFKKVFPNSVLVALEADPANFENLLYNTREVDGVHAVHGGLWSQHMMLRQSNIKGTHILSQPTGNKPTGSVIGLSVSDLQTMFDIPNFDFVYLDIEGAENVVLGAASDLNWMDTTKAICIKTHKKFGKFYMVDDLMRRISPALDLRRFVVVTDDEDHVILLEEGFAQELKNSLNGNGEGQGERR